MVPLTGKVRALGRSLLGAIAFYTVLPLPRTWALDVERVARWAPFVGVAIASLLALADRALEAIAVPLLVRSALVVALWVHLTGGLHLDGAIDTADGLGVSDPQRRLEILRESTTGAFGAIAAATLLLLKTVALGELETARWLSLSAAAGWGRWGQVAAIAFYPYLRAEGKGRLHKDHMRLPQDVLLGLAAMGALSWAAGWTGGAIAGGGVALALASGAWLQRCFGGHTGDTYGAVVEWTEALLLCWLTVWIP